MRTQPCRSLPALLICLPALAALSAGITADMLARGAASVAEAQRAVLRHVGPHTLLVGVQHPTQQLHPSVASPSS
jgi:hypothetical protein